MVPGWGRRDGGPPPCPGGPAFGRPYLSLPGGAFGRRVDHLLSPPALCRGSLLPGGDPASLRDSGSACLPLPAPQTPRADRGIRHLEHRGGGAVRLDGDLRRREGGEEVVPEGRGARDRGPGRLRDDGGGGTTTLRT